MRKKIFLVILISSLAMQLKAQTFDLFFEQANEFFKKNVDANGKIDYVKLKKSPGELLYILNNISNLNTSNENKNTSKAFWINSYNLYVIKGILDNYPLKSVNHIEGFFKETTFKIANQELTLDDIQNTILREVFLDPAVHFVLNLGCAGSPPLLNEAYLPQKVDEQIKNRTILYLNNKDIIRYDSKTKSISMPKIFEWFRSDFITYYGNEIDFINIFLEKKLDRNLTIKFYTFDWSLNQL